MAKDTKSKGSTTGNNLSSEMIKNIDNYSNSIIHIEGTINQIRTRPGMYIGPLGAAGLLNMFREIFQNSIDQLVDRNSPCDHISILFDERDYKIVISDNGMGIPFDKMVQIYTEGHTGKNLGTKRPYEYSAGTNGIGAKATNALSDYFDVVSYRYDGTAKHVRFERGKLKKEEKIKNPNKLQGTVVEFVPDHSILGDTPLDPGIIYTLVRDILSLTPIGSKIHYTSVSKTGKHYDELMTNEVGIITNILGKCGSMIVPPITINEDNGTMKLDVAFTFDQSDLNGEDITSYANMCPTSNVPMNSHVSGTLDGISTWFCNYMNKTYLTDREKQKIRILPIDVKEGLKLMISAFHLEPQFTGQAKEVFSNVDFKPFAKQVIMSGLDTWAKDKSQDLLKICKFLKDVANIRIKTDTEKVKVTAKYETSAITGLPASYFKPTGKEHTELFIVEGKSALGAAKSARDVKTQGVFPIRGKILNVWQATPQKIADNAEVMGIAHILGAGYGKNFDINKVKFEKIIFMSDADHDRKTVGKYFSQNHAGYYM